MSMTEGDLDHPHEYSQEHEDPVHLLWNMSQEEDDRVGLLPTPRVASVQPPGNFFLLIY